MRIGKYYVSTGFKRRRDGGFWHMLIAVHRRWRVGVVYPDARPYYTRVYVGPLEIEWSASPTIRAAKEGE